MVQASLDTFVACAAQLWCPQHNAMRGRTCLGGSEHVIAFVKGLDIITLEATGDVLAHSQSVAVVRCDCHELGWCLSQICLRVFEIARDVVLGSPDRPCQPLIARAVCQIAEVAGLALVRSCAFASCSLSLHH